MLTLKALVRKANAARRIATGEKASVAITSQSKGRQGRKDGLTEHVYVGEIGRAHV